MASRVEGESSSRFLLPAQVTQPVQPDVRASVRACVCAALAHLQCWCLLGSRGGCGEGQEVPGHTTHSPSHAAWRTTHGTSSWQAPALLAHKERACPRIHRRLFHKIILYAGMLCAVNYGTGNGLLPFANPRLLTNFSFFFLSVSDYFSFFFLSFYFHPFSRSNVFLRQNVRILSIFVVTPKVVCHVMSKDINKENKDPQLCNDGVSSSCY